MTNPFTYFHRQFELERARDREMFLSAIRELCDTNNRHSEAVTAQAEMLRRFFDAFITNEQPTARHLTDEDEAETERQQWQVHGES